MFLVDLLVVCILVGLAYWIITTLLPEPIRKVAVAILVVFAVLWLLGMLTGNVPMCSPHLFRR